MPVLLYHGSGQYFEQPDLEKTRGFLDFGRGFYLTTYLRQAQDWALRKLRPSDIGTRAYIYEYQFDSERQRELNVLELLEYNNTWLEFVMGARDAEDAGTQYDLIYDKMADGHLQTIIRQFSKQKINEQTALKRLRFPSRDQYCFKSPKALGLIHRLRYAELNKTDGDPIVEWHTVGGDEND